jgi:hypothetical protein
MPLSRLLSILGWAWSMVQTVRGERGIGLGDSWRGESWRGSSHGDSMEALYDVTEDIGSWNCIRGGAERIASCCCSQ